METAFDVGPVEGSALALAEVRLEPGQTVDLAGGDDDVLLYVFAGDGRLALADGELDIAADAAALALAGEVALVTAGVTGLALVRATAGPACERHAPLGAVERVVALATVGSGDASGARSFSVLLGPHNGSTRATLFAGFVAPGRAPWHYHLYDEIVWVPEGPGRLHLGEESAELRPGAAFRLRPRQVHIVENTSPDRLLTILGVFTPAGSPAAAYLPPGVAGEYGLADGRCP